MIAGGISLYAALRHRVCVWDGVVVHTKSALPAAGDRIPHSPPSVNAVLVCHTKSSCHAHSSGLDAMQVRDSLGLPFPNLPYLVDGDTKLTQSTAILRHIGREYGLCGRWRMMVIMVVRRRRRRRMMMMMMMAGSTPEEEMWVDQLVEEAVDFRREVMRLAYSPNFTAVRFYKR
jgi:hypothetical protein